MTLTKTARKKVLKDAQSLPHDVEVHHMISIASRHNVSALAVRDLLIATGHRCEALPRDRPRPQPQPRPSVTVSRPKLPISRQEAAMIRSCKLYKTLYHGSDTVMVPTHSFRRERDAIIKLLDAFEKEH